MTLQVSPRTTQAGAQYGFNYLWLSLWTFPLMSVVQEMCARIGLVTGRGLAAIFASITHVKFCGWQPYSSLPRMHLT